MYDGVIAAGGDQPLGHVHDQFGIHDGHIRGKRVIGDGVFQPGAVVSDDCKWGYFGTGSRGGGDGNQDGFLPDHRKSVDTFANVHETQGQAFEFHVGVFIEHPDDLGRVHGRTAAQSNDHVRLEGIDQSDTLFHRAQGGVRLYLVEAFALDPHRFQDGGNAVDVSQVEKGGVGHDEGAFLSLQVLQSNR